MKPPPLVIAVATATIPKLAYSIEEAMVATTFGRQALYDDINSGILIARKRGPRTVILAEDLAAYLAALPPFRPYPAEPE